MIAFVDDSNFFSNGTDSEENMQMIADKYVILYKGGTDRKIKNTSVSCYSWV